jgi:hypothetical protein
MVRVERDGHSSSTISHIRQSLDGLHLIANPSAGLDESTRLAAPSTISTLQLFFFFLQCVSSFIFQTLS